MSRTWAWFLACGLLACSGESTLDAKSQLRARVTELGLVALSEPPPQAANKVALGRALFFDPILSGNRDISCATCHHPVHGASDQRSLSVGTQAQVVDGTRLPGPNHTFVPRNAIAPWDIGQLSLSVVFWDRRLAQLEDGRIVLYDAGYDLSGEFLRVISPQVETVAGAVALFPVIDRDEMRGEWGESDILGQPNELAMIVDPDFEGIWRALINRLRAVDGYRELLTAAYPSINLEDLEFAHAAMAIGAFMTEAFSSTQGDSRTPWDNFLDGNDHALDEAQARGALLFYRPGSCADCHDGTLMSDQAVYNYGVRPMGTGVKHDHEYVDLGAASNTLGGDSHRYAFRTPRLRNVTRTGPWMHNGLYTSLEAVIRHKADPIERLKNYDRSQLAVEFQGQVHQHPDIIADVQVTMSQDVQEGVELSDEQIADLLAFLQSLTSPHALTLSELIPDQVPSGLPLVSP